MRYDNNTLYQFSNIKKASSWFWELEKEIVKNGSQTNYTLVTCIYTLDYL